ncbi:MAG: hypothetical protein IT435_02385 [Phycisphaerales bacterium]|nr:hypothetical protein [Phycisphaerales bacterium]
MADETPPNLDITLVRGDTWQTVFQVREDDQTTVIDLTGYDARIQVRRLPLDPESAALDLTVGSGLTINAGLGEITAVAQTASLIAGEYAWDLQLTAPGGLIETVMGGRFTLVQDVTEPV